MWRSPGCWRPAAGAVAFWNTWTGHPPRVDSAAKGPGRAESIYVREGDMGRRGQVIATLDGTEIRARAAQAHAARDAARATRDRALHRFRTEEIRSAHDNHGRAAAAAAIAETTFVRFDRLLK